VITKHQYSSQFVEEEFVTALNKCASPRPEIHTLPGQAGGIVTLIFEF
jgi:hypothetical protein